MVLYVYNIHCKAVGIQDTDGATKFIFAIYDINSSHPNPMNIIYLYCTS